MFVKQKVKIAVLQIGLLIMFPSFSPVSAATVKCPLLKGKPYKISNEKAIYYITQQCTKKAFIDSVAFFSLFKSWKDVKNTTKRIINKIPNDKQFLIAKKESIVATLKPVSLAPSAA